MAVLNTIRAWNSFLLNVDAPPDISGVRAGIDSIAVTQFGAIYKKTGILDTDWLLLSEGLGPYAPAGYYGNFYSNANQTNPIPNAHNVMTYNNAIGSNGVSIVANSQITVANAGQYNIQFSSQVTTTSGSDKELFIWLKVNGLNVAHSNTQIDIQGGSKKSFAAWNFFVELNAGDYAEIAWLTSDANMLLAFFPANVPLNMPEIPSVILTVNQVAGV